MLSYEHADAALAGRVCKALAESGLEVTDPDHDHVPGENWAGEVAHALEESDAMVVLLTPAGVTSPDVRRNVEYALGTNNYRISLIPFVVGGLERFPTSEVPWIVRRMPSFELDDVDTDHPEVEPFGPSQPNSRTLFVVTESRSATTTPIHRVHSNENGAASSHSSCS